MIKQSLVALAISGTLTASQFLTDVKNFIPKETAQNLNIQSKGIKAQKRKHLTDEQILVIEQSIQTMIEVNERTFSDFLPSIDIALQRWVKEDKSSIESSLVWINEALNLRIKQYNNMKMALKNSNVSDELLEKIANMDRLSRRAKKIIKKYEEQITVISSIENELKTIENINDFWLPVIEENQNSVIVDIKDIDKNNFDKIEEIEESLNQQINSKYIQYIMVA